MFLHGDDLEYITETDFQSNRNTPLRQIRLATSQTNLASPSLYEQSDKMI